MGRLIDADVLREEICSWGMNIYEPSDFTDAIDNAPTVEAIQKADYEKRLKADMVAMLTEIQVGIGEHINPSNHTDSYEDGWSEGAEWCIDYIQEKINSLKENENEKR